MKKILLDTCAYTQLLAGEEKVLSCLAAAQTVFMSVIVLGELYAGFRGGNRLAFNLDLLQKFLQKPSVEVLDVTEETSEIFGLLKNTLKKSGAPVPLNDLWIAAQAIDSGSELVTSDAHFRHISGLRLRAF